MIYYFLSKDIIIVSLVFLGLVGLVVLIFGLFMIILENLKMKNDRVFPISVNSLRFCYQRLCNKLNIKIRFHDFRHEAISRLFEQYLSIPHIASISGHRTMSQLFRYAHYKGSI